MLVLSRRPGEGLQIELGDSAAPTTTIGELFRDGPIRITVTQVDRNRVKLGIQADPRLLVLRSELHDRPKAAKRVVGRSK
ncbi:hypothetical protein SVA_0885 [Sulfurifustis variabilis]|uniref:Carbon storage regulator n=1 Tax=Sulfurifustis variabilis TaxID=1675686 RepID=A0A1B4V7W2_9GAMM|nr:carbon storage regulator [Sulfurifustis variabilis]BAU47464.1 hypothetical protein SVA_0885 [Sulfurifustis variabilis]